MRSVAFAPRRNSIPRRAQPGVPAVVNDASVEGLRVLPEDERHLRPGARVSDIKVTPPFKVEYRYLILNYISGAAGSCTNCDRYRKSFARRLTRAF